jgi:preprotein translocase subunit SecY
MLRTVADIFRQKELRKKILVTLGLLTVFRLGAWLPIPLINYEVFRGWFESMRTGAFGTMFGMMGMITAGSLSRATVFSLGIMPYISSSIIMQLLTKVIPALKEISEEGGSGRKRINQYTRYLTVAICLVQSFVACMFLARQGTATQPMYFGSRTAFLFLGVMTITTGTMVLMWLGEQISEYGLGNGISLIIMVGIISRIPAGLIAAVKNFSFSPEGAGEFGVGVATVLIGLFLAILFSVVYIYLGKRMIPVQYGRQVRGRKVMGGQKQAIWLRVNQAGVIPVIFASALMTAPQVIFGFMSLSIFGFQSFEYNVFYVLLIIFFSYFYTSMVFNPNELADQLKEHGSFVPGYRAGKKTAEFFRDTMVHLTFVGGIFLAIVAMLPKILGSFIKIQFLMYSSLFGGVGLLIVIGVSLDLMQKIQEHFYMRDYGGFLKKKLRGRRR